jgi:hypothetical protein
MPFISGKQTIAFFYLLFAQRNAKRKICGACELKTTKREQRKDKMFHIGIDLLSLKVCYGGK